MVTYFNADYKNNKSDNGTFIEYMEGKQFNMDVLKNYFIKHDPNHYEGVVLHNDLTDIDFMRQNFSNILNYISNIVCIINSKKSTPKSKS